MYVHKKWTGTKPCVLAVYVDDIIIITESDEEMNAIKQQLCEGFKMKDMASYIICWESVYKCRMEK